MKIRRGSSRCCPNPACRFNEQYDKGNIIRHSFYTTTQGRRRRFCCRECGKTFSSTQGSDYYRLHKPRFMFDEVILMCVNGIAISAVARIKGIAYGTVFRWLELAAMFAERFNHRNLRGFVIHELQADAIQTFIGNRKQVVWILTTLEVWSRLLISVDGFEMHEGVVKRLLAGICIYGQVIKKGRENRVIRADRKLFLGTREELEEALFQSEDSSALNTSFIERHNSTIRQGCSYLGRRTPSYARQSKSLASQMALMMLYHNFVRPHMALKLGKLVKTSAMQAGLTAKRVSFWDVFTASFLFFLFAKYCRFDQSW